MDQIILNKIDLYFGLQYKPSSGADWKKICKKKTVTVKISIKIRNNDW